MVKILSLIGSLMVAAGTGLMGFALSMLGNTLSIEVFFRMASLADLNVPGFAQILVYGGLILIFISGFIKTNALSLIGGIISIIAIFGCLAGWLTNDYTGNMIYGNLYFPSSLLLIVGWLLYFIGCIKFRKKNKIAWLTALLIFLALIVVNVYFGIIAIMSDGFSEGSIFLHLVSLTGLYLLFFLHGFIYFFSKKKSWLSGDGRSSDDAYSVSGGNAFASYVPEDDAYAVSSKKKKKKKKGGDDDFDFNF